MSRLRLPSRTGAGHAPLAMDAIGFDVYGTLVDPLGIEPALREIAGDRAGELARAWRARQIEYSFRRSLMGAWAPFGVCTRDALQHATLATSGMALTSEAGDRLLALYGRLPAFPDAAPGLRALRERGHRLVAFSNGSAHAVREVLGHSGLLEQLDDVVSVAEVRIFKPHPSVYQHLAHRVGQSPGHTWLVSGNAWDVVGAKASGLRTAWVQRSPVPFDPWGGPPELTARDLTDVARLLATPPVPQVATGLK